MSTFQATDLAAAAAKIAAAMPDIAPELNAADSLLGDGDTGGMLARVAGAVARVDVVPDEDMGETLANFARAVGSATGSSLGSLLMSGFSAASHDLHGRASISAAEVAPLMARARDAMLYRGQCSLGDKTMIDAVEAVRAAVTGLDDSETMARRAMEAVTECLASFRDRPCLVGRARMFGDKSRGLHDPGMLGIARLVAAACDAGKAPPSAGL